MGVCRALRGPLEISRDDAGVTMMSQSRQKRRPTSRLQLSCDPPITRSEALRAGLEKGDYDAAIVIADGLPFLRCIIARRCFSEP
jgi:hypothetical protein